MLFKIPVRETGVSSHLIWRTLADFIIFLCKRSN